MSSTEMTDEVVNLHQELYRIPSLKSAEIILTNNNLVKVRSVWSERNLERCSNQIFLQETIFNSNLEILVGDGFPTDITSEILSDTSKDGNLKAILRQEKVDGKSKQYIEIWDKRHLRKSYDLSAFDVHGDVYYSDLCSNTSSFQLSPDNTKLLYIAEKKVAKSEPFYKQKAKNITAKSGNDEENSIRGAEYIYKPDWGEGNVGKSQSVIAILNLLDDTIDVLTTIPVDYFPNEVLWGPDGTDILGVVYKLDTQYSESYTVNRESYIFHLKDSKFSEYKVTSNARSIFL